MSAPILWMVLPGLIAILLIFVRKYENLTSIIAGAVCVLLVALTMTLPIGTSVSAGPFQFTLPGELPVFGRRFVLTQADLAVIALLYGIGAFWFFASIPVKNKPTFVPLGLGILAILAGVLSVEPFLYGPLLIEVAVLGCMALTATRGKPAGKGELRFLIFQTLAVPLTLLAGWFLSSGEVTPINETQLLQSSLLLGLGFAFWLAVFPLHTWVEMASEEIPPITSGFIFSVLPLSISLFLLDFLNSYAWLRNYPIVFPALRWLGAIMVLASGLWAFFQTEIKRLYGFMVLFMTGITLLTISLNSETGITLFAYSLLPRLASIALLSLSLAIIDKTQTGTRLQNLHGMVYRSPFTSLGVVIGIFSAAGVPLLANFPIIQPLLAKLNDTSALFVAALALGSVLLFFSGYKLLVVVFMKPEAISEKNETGVEKILMGGLIFLVLVIGIFPSLLLSPFLSILTKFPFLLQ